MTPDEFRRMALGLEGAQEGAHMGHADFRVGGRVFATLGYPDSGWGVVQLPPEQQVLFLEDAPDVFQPAKGAWGAQGSTCLRLSAVASEDAERALRAAWLHRQAKSRRRS